MSCAHLSKNVRMSLAPKGDKNLGKRISIMNSIAETEKKRVTISPGDESTKRTTIGPGMDDYTVAFERPPATQQSENSSIGNFSAVREGQHQAADSSSADDDNRRSSTASEQ